MSGPRAILLDFTPLVAGALVGRARVRLPSGLEIADIGIFRKDGRAWAQLPAEPMRNQHGEVLKDDRGKVRYRSSLKWQTKDLQDRFSATLLALVAAAHPEFLGKSGAT
jgi:hypothetical protein